MKIKIPLGYGNTMEVDTNKIATREDGVRIGKYLYAQAPANVKADSLRILLERGGDLDPLLEGKSFQEEFGRIAEAAAPPPKKEFETKVKEGLAELYAHNLSGMTDDEYEKKLREIGLLQHTGKLTY